MSLVALTIHILLIIGTLACISYLLLRDLFNLYIYRMFYNIHQPDCSNCMNEGKTEYCNGCYGTAKNKFERKEDAR